MEYLVLIALLISIFYKVIGHVEDIFYGWDGEKGAIELFVTDQVVYKLSNPGSW